MRLRNLLNQGVSRAISTLSSLSSVRAVLLLSMFFIAVTTISSVITTLYDGLLLGVTFVLIVGFFVLFARIVQMQEEQVRQTEALSDLTGAVSRIHAEQSINQKQTQYHVKKMFERYTHIIYAEVEAYHNINQKISLKHPLPSMSGWAATPDLINKIIDLIQDDKIKTVLDLGSGVSTIAAGYALGGTKGGKVISLDHDKEYMGYTQAAIDKHGLSDVIDLRYAPLEEQRLNGEQCVWYSQKALTGVHNVDLLIVDGPPQDTQLRARFPALPALYDSLSKNAIVLVDDYARKDERSMVDLWMSMYPEFKRIEIQGLKGIAVLSR